MKIMRKAGKNNNNNWQFETMKSIRKQMPNPSKIHDEYQEFDKRDEEFEDMELPTLKELIHDAESITSIKGHTLGKWHNLSDTSMTNTCINCQKSITVNSDPLQMELDIDGPASKDDCQI
jgi:hypothetical protein